MSCIQHWYHASEQGDKPLRSHTHCDFENRLPSVGRQKSTRHAASVAAYVDCALEASEVLPASLVPHITDARLLDVQFCAITRRLESLLANRQQNQQTHENGSTSADFDGEMTHLLLALQENADAKLRCVEMVNGMLRDKVDQLDQCKRVVVSGDTNINRQAGTPSIGEPGWGIVPRNQETTERRPISRATAAALEKDSQQNTPAFGHNANNYGNFSACTDGKESAGRPQKRRRVIRGKTTTQSQTNVSNDSTKDEDISGQNISFQNRSRLNTPVAGSGDAGGAGSRCVSEAPSLASSGHAPTTGARRGKRQKQSNSRLPSPASASKSSNSDFQGKIGEGAKRGRKQTQNRDKDLDEDDSDVDEETYCFCEQVSYGDMICCDYASCVIEWFHFGCVGVSAKPKGKWYCPNCRGDKPTVLKSGLGGKGKG